MIRTVFIRRLSFAMLLVIALCAGWLLRGVSFDDAPAGNVPLSVGTVPISSSLDAATSVPDMPLALDSAGAILVKLTAGLHPGRGQPIPPAADVHELPVIDISFYNWRGELLSGWLSLTTPAAPVIILTYAERESPRDSSRGWSAVPCAGEVRGARGVRRDIWR